MNATDILAPHDAQGADSSLIRLDGIRKSYGAVEVLKGVDLAVAKGEVVAMIGPSGSGKSTLLRCVNQLEFHTGGSVTVDGTVIAPGGHPEAKALQRLRRKVGMVFQSFNLFPHLSVLRNVSIAQERVLKRSRKEADERSMQLLSRVGLADKGAQFPSRCSGGQQQRIAIARALALDPEVMLFDEPTSALDPELGVEVLTVMRELAQNGMTMIVVTHEMHFAEDVSNRVVVMADGMIIEEGPSKQVMTAPSAERTQRFLRAVRDR